MNKRNKNHIIDSYCEDLNSIGLNPLGIAVSGGSDSMALFHLSVIWGQRTGNELKVASVDHGLRRESTSEIDFVRKIVNQNRIAHFTLKSEIDISKAQGNIQENARNVRYDLLTDWAKREGIKTILVGHTLDDQEENLLIRFFRGSGVDGLGSIEKRKLRKNILWFRPLLEYRREFLQEYLRNNENDWVEDPSNKDSRFKRVRVRKLLPKLKEDGLIKKNFVETAKHMQRASLVLRATAICETKSMIKISEIGEIRLNLDKFLNTFPDTRLRILSGLISWYSGNFYKPRFSKIERLQKLITEKKEIQGVVLGGVVFKKEGSVLSLNREFSAIKIINKIRQKTVLWDNRWLLTFNNLENQDIQVVPLGSINYQKKDIFSEQSLNKGALNTLPALKQSNKLIFTPFSNLEYSLDVKLLSEEEYLFKYF